MASPVRAGRISNLWFGIQPLILIVVLLFLSFYTNEAIIEYRLREYDRAMEQLSSSYNLNHSLNMLARFEMIEKRREIPDEDEAVLEMKLQALSSGRLVEGREGESLPPGQIAVQYAIAAVRLLLGKEKAASALPKERLKELELAYFYERARKYQDAAAIYSKSLEQPEIESDMQATLHLHLGFCRSMLGKHDDAIAALDRVRVIRPGSDEASVAARLIEKILGLKERVGVARRRKLGPFEAGKEMFLLANYPDAISALERYLGNPGADTGNTMQAFYLLGRAQEELGREEEAIAKYRHLLARRPESSWAKKANRRLYLMGKLYANDDELARAALKRVEQYEDFEFINRLKKINVPQMRPKAAGSGNWADSLAGREPAGGPLDAVDVGDLRGLKTPVAKSKDEAAGSADIRPEGELEPSRKARTSKARKVADPLRREAVHSAIQSNRQELEFIYRKWLRKGRSFEGTLTFRIIIRPNGNVHDARIVTERSTISHSAFISEVLENVKKWKFRPFSGGDLPVSFPVEFVAKE